MDLLRKEALKKLAANLSWFWDDGVYAGVPAIDCKRPYGNSDIDVDILETLDIKPDGDDGNGPVYSSKQREWALELHKDLLPYLKELTGAK